LKNPWRIFAFSLFVRLRNFLRIDCAVIVNFKTIPNEINNNAATLLRATGGRGNLAIENEIASSQRSAQ
jgi:hypothetical protein